MLNQPMSDESTLKPDQEARRAVASQEAQASRHESWFGPSRVVWHRWGAGRPVVLLHGGAGSWTHWIRNIDELARRYTVWVPDLPGFGESDALAEPVSLELLADALQRGTHTLLPAGQPVAVVGFSLGAHLSVLLAHRLKEQVAQLVLVGGNLVDDRPPERRGLVNWMKVESLAARRVALRTNLAVMMLADPALINGLALYLYEQDVMRQRLRPAALARGGTMRDELARLDPRVRVTGISGARDQVFGYVLDRQAEALHTLRPDAPFYLVSGGGHWVMYEAAAAFNELLGRVLDSRDCNSCDELSRLPRRGDDRVHNNTLAGTVRDPAPEERG